MISNGRKFEPTTDKEKKKILFEFKTKMKEGLDKRI